MFVDSLWPRESNRHYQVSWWAHFSQASAFDLQII